MLSIQLIEYGSSQYEAELKLREKILRNPLGLTLMPSEIANDPSSIHIAAFMDDSLRACLILSPLEPTLIKMRQVAVDTELQGQGIGKKLVHFAEKYAQENAFNEIKLNARESVLPFYLSLGYEAYGDLFNEIGIPHRAMRKKL